MEIEHWFWVFLFFSVGYKTNTAYVTLFIGDFPRDRIFSIRIFDPLIISCRISMCFVHFSIILFIPFINFQVEFVLLVLFMVFIIPWEIHMGFTHDTPSNPDCLRSTQGARHQLTQRQAPCNGGINRWKIQCTKGVVVFVPHDFLRRKTWCGFCYIFLYILIWFSSHKCVKMSSILLNIFTKGVGVKKLTTDSSLCVDIRYAWVTSSLCPTHGLFS